MGSDNRINSLCNRLLASSSDEEVAALASELKVAFHEHIESLRTQLKGSLQRHSSDDMVPDTCCPVIAGCYLAADRGRWAAALFSLFIHVVVHDEAPCVNLKHLKK